MKRQNWIKELVFSYDEVIYNHKLKLSRPFILIKDIKPLGVYHAGSGSITLSHQLLKKQPWHVVEEILKHEMAHQYVHEVTKGPLDHGKVFWNACQIIGVQYWARHARVELQDPSIFDYRETIERSQNTRLVDKVKKLLALSKSSHTHEAALAMQKVQELTLKYNLSICEQENGGLFTEVISLQKKRLENYISRICRILINYFYVKIVYSHEYSVKKGRWEQNIHLLGKSSHVKVAVYVFYYLRRQLEIFWKEYKSLHHLKGLFARNSYYTGVLQGFDMKLKQEKKTKKFYANETEKQQIVEKDFALEYYQKMLFPRLSTCSSSQRMIDEWIYEAGKQQGYDMTIRSGLNSSSPQKIFRLAPPYSH